MQPKQQRNVTVDVAKGLGILLVVAGHNKGLQQIGEASRVIYSFHMPLFFFLAGIFLREKEGFLKTASSRIDSLLKPYFVVFLFLGLGKILVGATTWSQHFPGVLYGVGNTIPWMPLWFLPHMLIASLLAWSIVRATAVIRTGRSALIAAIAMSMLVFGSITLDVFYRSNVVGLPWSVDVAMVSTAYLLLGFASREAVLNARFNVLHFAVALTAFIAFHALFDATIDLNTRRFDAPPIAIAQSLLGIYLLVYLSAWLNGLRPRTLCYLGSTSLFILIFHQFIQAKAFDAIHGLSGSHAMSGFAAFLMAVFGSVAIFEVTRRSRYLSALMLPMRNGKSTTRSVPASSGMQV